MRGLPTTPPVDFYIEHNGNTFFNTRPDEQPRRELGDCFKSTEPSPDDEERWDGKRTTKE